MGLLLFGWTVQLMYLDATTTTTRSLKALVVSA